MGSCRCGAAAMEISSVKGEGEREAERFLPFESRTHLLPFSLRFPLTRIFFFFFFNYLFFIFSIDFHFQAEPDTRKCDKYFYENILHQNSLSQLSVCIDFRHGDAILVFAL